MTLNEAKSIIKQHGLYALREQAIGSYDDFIAKLSDLWAEQYSDDENYQSIDEMLQDEWYAQIIDSYYDDGFTPTQAVEQLIDDIYEESQTIDNENDFIGDDEETEDNEDYSDFPEDDELGKLNGMEDPDEYDRIPAEDETDVYDDIEDGSFPADEDIREAVEVLDRHGYMLNEANEFRGMDAAALARLKAFQNCYASAKTNNALRTQDKIDKFIYGFASFIPDAPARGKQKLMGIINTLNARRTENGWDAVEVDPETGEIDGAVPPQPTGRGGDNPNRHGGRVGNAPAAHAAPAAPRHEEPAEEAPAPRQEAPAHQAPAEVNVQISTRRIQVVIDTEGGAETEDIKNAFDSLVNEIDEYDAAGNKLSKPVFIEDNGNANIEITFICDPNNLNDELSRWVANQIESKFENVFTFVDVNPQAPAEIEVPVKQNHGLMDNTKPGPLPAQYQELFADVPAAGEEQAREEAPANEPAADEEPEEEAPAQPAVRNREPRRVNGPIHRMPRAKQWRVYYHPVGEDGNVQANITDNVVVTAPTQEEALKKLNEPEDPDNPIVYDYKPGDFNERRPNEGGSFIEIWEEI